MHNLHVYLINIAYTNGTVLALMEVDYNQLKKNKKVLWKK